jgi:hypothetical protein
LIKAASNLIEKQYADSLKEKQKARTIQLEDHIDELLAVPRYAALLDEDSREENAQTTSVFVNTQKRWRTEMKKWVDAAGEFDQEIDNDSIAPPLPQGTPQGWLPRSLESLFGGMPSAEPQDGLGDRLTRR